MCVVCVGELWAEVGSEGVGRERAVSRPSTQYANVISCDAGLSGGVCVTAGCGRLNSSPIRMNTVHTRTHTHTCTQKPIHTHSDCVSGNRIRVVSP